MAMRSDSINIVQTPALRCSDLSTWMTRATMKRAETAVHLPMDAGWPRDLDSIKEIIIPCHEHHRSTTMYTHVCMYAIHRARASTSDPQNRYNRSCTRSHSVEIKPVQNFAWNSPEQQNFNYESGLDLGKGTGDGQQEAKGWQKRKVDVTIETNERRRLLLFTLSPSCQHLTRPLSTRADTMGRFRQMDSEPSDLGTRLLIASPAAQTVPPHFPSKGEGARL